ncbi:hypothetical protein K3495_g1565 [Podosphaera aphanis]|nr:hypothetical protein K3495_g1565 [Podosphaera aphanis]
MARVGVQGHQLAGTVLPRCTPPTSVRLTLNAGTAVDLIVLTAAVAWPARLDLARAKTAVKRAEAAAIAAAVPKLASPPALSVSNQSKVLAEDTTLSDAEVTGETTPKHSHERRSTSPFAPPSYSKFYASQCR